MKSRMRSEKEMMDLILDTAKEDDRIRAVYMNGSRTNPNAVRDRFQDYDIVYVVTDTAPFYEDEKWIDRFGERLYMQMPEYMDSLRGWEYHPEQIYGWLILFTDGNRIDLHVSSVSWAQEDIVEDRLCRILLDKDGILPEMPPSTDADHYVKKPSANEYRCDCNDFRWCLNNIAKGLARGEATYAMDMLYDVVRPYLTRMLTWKIGAENSWACSVGKSGKYMYRYLPEKTWQRFLNTVPDCRIPRMWEAVYEMVDLFEETACEVAGYLGTEYDREEAEAAKEYLDWVRQINR